MSDVDIVYDSCGCCMLLVQMLYVTDAFFLYYSCVCCVWLMWM